MRLSAVVVYAARDRRYVINPLHRRRLVLDLKLLKDNTQRSVQDTGRASVLVVIVQICISFLNIDRLFCCSPFSRDAGVFGYCVLLTGGTGRLPILSF